MALAERAERFMDRIHRIGWLRYLIGHPFTPILLTWLLSSIYLLYAHYDALLTSLNDTDDALRLVEMRRFLDGAGWYDMRIPRMNPPEGLWSHWSRLIDAGLAGLYLFLSLFLSPDAALLWTRALWPLLTLLPAIAGIFLIVRRFVGRSVDKELALLLFLGSILFFQYFPARVDHHNVQAALLMLAWGLVLWADCRPFAGWLSGFMVAMDLAIGLEIMPLALLATATLVAGYAFDPNRFALPLRKHALALAGGMVLFLSLAMPPFRWNESACDTLAANYAFPTALTALLLAVLTSLDGLVKTPWQRLAGVAIAGFAGLALLIAMDPSCLKGPFAHVDPAVRPIWLDHVKEMQPLFSDFRENLVVIALYFFWPLTALAVAFWLWRPRLHARDLHRWALFVIVIIAVLLAIPAVRMGPYALMFSLALTGISMTFMPKVKKHPALVLGISPLTLVLAISLSMDAIKNGMNANPKAPNAANHNTQKHAACNTIKTIKALNNAPKGLILTHSNFGPAILALTPHSVVSGPYHRIAKAIIASSRILTAPADEAYPMLLKRGIDYVLYCPKTQMLAPGGKKPGKKALWNRLAKGDVPAWLERVPLKEKDNPLQLYRVVTPWPRQTVPAVSGLTKTPALRKGMQ